jgi:hypothetical protein
MSIQLFDLPLNLTADLLRNWLLCRDLSALDAALCNRSSREAYLDVLRSVAFVLDEPSVKVLRTPVMQWVIDRKVKIIDVFMGFSPPPSDEIISSFLACVGPRVLDLTAAGDEDTLVSICRSALSTCVRLKVLELWSYSFESRTADRVFSRLISQRSATLERLTCTDCWTKKLLPTDCEMPKLQYFSTSATHKGNLCAFVRNCRHLLYFKCSHIKPCDESILHALAESCPSLQSLHYGY